MDRNVKSYPVKGGTLYVGLYAATLEVTGRWEVRKVTGTPALMIASHPEFHYRNVESDAGVTIRGRVYRVHTGRTPSTPYQNRVGRERTWQVHGSLNYNQFLNDQGQPIAWDSKTAEQLSTMVDEVCDLYVAEFPEWRNDSIRLAVDSLRDSAESKVKSLHEEMEKQQAKVDRLAALLAKRTLNPGSININDIDRR
jgi:hypothetical protein